MDERLKQIWSGFEEVTTRRLTGRGVDNIAVPHRTDYAAEDASFLTEEFTAPAEAAFSALREELGRKEKKFGRKKKSAREDATEAMSQSYNGDELLRGLRATALRTERPERDYQAFLSSAEGKAVYKKNKRKKRFGLF